jgi:nicotinamidase/pyrazinamidase
MNAIIGPGGLQHGDVLLVVDMQSDFVSGALAVPDAAAVIAPLNRYIREFVQRDLRVVATRDWHPPHHMSFREEGGPWPPHCVAGTEGAAFTGRLKLPPNAWIVSKATHPSREASSAFEGTDLAARLTRLRARRLFVGGLATDCCVLRTVLGALGHGFETWVLADAIRPVEVNPGDGDRAEDEMQRAGAHFVCFEDLFPETEHHA